MKICPTCQTKYTDDTLQYCLQDGAHLEFGASDTSSMETVALSDEEAQTVMAPRKPEKINFDLDDREEERKEPEQSFQSASSTDKHRPNTLSTVFITAAIMLLLLGGIGTAAWFYYLRQNPEIAKTSNTNSNIETRNRGGANASASSPSPTSTATPEETSTPTPEETPEIDREEITKAVSAQLSLWKSFAEARNIAGYIGKYAPKLDYYNKRGASKRFVLKDKQKAFSAFTSIKSKLSDIGISTSKDGQTATAVFDKEWDFSGPEKSTTGKVRSQLIFKKFDDEWLIVSERDLKVYYVNRS